MTETVRIGEVDMFGTDDLRELASPRPGPCVSIFLPTHRSGPETQQDPLRLRNLIDRAAAQLLSSGIDPRLSEEILGPHRALLGDVDFWRHQADGLALYGAAGFQRRFRVALPLGESVAVADLFHIRPLLPLIAGDGRFFVLAVSQNRVQLYEATRSTMAELPSGPIPASMTEALAHEDPERQLQFRSGGDHTAQFHGHGAGEEIDKKAVERFLRAVDRGVISVLGDATQPLVLAGVAYYAPIYRSITRYPNVIDRSVAGNPEHRSPVELHAEALPLVEPILDSARREALRRLDEAPPSQVATALTDVLAAATEGRVETLLVSPAAAAPRPDDRDAGSVPVAGRRPGAVEDLLERAVVETLLKDGKAFVVDGLDAKDLAAAALLRF